MVKTYSTTTTKATMNMDSAFEERKLRKMYVRKHQMTLIKYARKVHGEYVVSTTEDCDAQYNRKCVHAVVHTLLKNGWDCLIIQTLIDLLPLHSWNLEEIAPLKYPQMVTLRFDSEKVKPGRCVLHADPKSYVCGGGRVPSLRHLAGRKWIDDQGFVLTENYLEIPGEFVDRNMQAIVQALTESGSRYRTHPGTFNYARFASKLPNGNFRFYRENEGASFAPKESFGICAKENNFSQCLMVDVCA